MIKTFAPTSSGWPRFWRSFVETLAEIGVYAIIAATVLGFFAWLALMPSIGFLWLVGRL